MNTVQKVFLAIVMFLIAIFALASGYFYGYQRGFLSKDASTAPIPTSTDYLNPFQ